MLSESTTPISRIPIGTFCRVPPAKRCRGWRLIKVMERARNGVRYRAWSRYKGVKFFGGWLPNEYEVRRVDLKRWPAVNERLK